MMPRWTRSTCCAANCGLLVRWDTGHRLLEATTTANAVESRMLPYGGAEMQPNKDSIWHNHQGQTTSQLDPAATAGTAFCFLDGRRAMSGRISDTSITIAITVMAGP